MTSKDGSTEQAADVAPRTSLMDRIRRILAREGPGGLARRLPFIFSARRKRAAPPRLTGSARIVADDDHAQAIRLVHRRFGRPLATVPGPHPRATIYLGNPPVPATAQDIVFLSGPGPVPRNARSAGLVAADDPARLQALSEAGRQVVAVTRPLDDASVARIEVLTGRRDPRGIDMSAAIRPALSVAVPRLCLTLPEYPSGSGFSAPLILWT